MIEFYINNQTLKFYTPTVAADTLEYLTAEFHFSENWDGYTRWAHFRNGSTVYDIELDENDCIMSGASLNLCAGLWEIFVTGTRETSRLTSTTVILEVKESGLVDAPLHAIPQSVAEQLDSKASQALLLAQSVRADADAGRFDGRSFGVKGFFDNINDLKNEGVPESGTVYGVLKDGSYEFYIWDEIHSEWVNNGKIMGIRGETGAVFTPYIDNSGNLSWSNNGGLENPQTRNIIGPAGREGQPGPAGKSAYDKAVEAGYTGTEGTFYAALTAMPYHNARHLPNGSDPLIITEAAIENGAVTASKLAPSAKSKSLSLTLRRSAWGSNKSCSVTAAGVTAQNNIIVSPATGSAKKYAESEVFCVSQGQNTLSFSCSEVPEADLSVNVLILV